MALASDAVKTESRPWQPAAVAWNAGTVFVVGSTFESTGGGHLLGHRVDGRLTAKRIPGLGRVAEAVFVGDGFIVAVADRTPPALERVQLARVRLGGKFVWGTAVGAPDSYNSSAILAWSPRRTLVCWERSPPGDATNNRMECEILSSNDGRVLRSPFELRSGKRTDAEHSVAIVNAALALDDGFLVAWRPIAHALNAEPGISLTRLDVDGRVLETIDLGAVDGQFVHLARTATGVVAAWDGGQAGVEMVWLDPDGRLRGGVLPKPIGISAGSGNAAYWPRLAARGDLVAASWRVREGMRTFVAATDPTGAVSPAVEIGAGKFPDDSALAADDAGFIAAYGSPGYPQIEPLRCRKQAPLAPDLGAPQRLAAPGP